MRGRNICRWLLIRLIVDPSLGIKINAHPHHKSRAKICHLFCQDRAGAACDISRRRRMGKRKKENVSKQKSKKIRWKNNAKWLDMGLFTCHGQCDRQTHLLLLGLCHIFWWTWFESRQNASWIRSWILNLGRWVAEVLNRKEVKCSIWTFSFSERQWAQNGKLLSKAKEAGSTHAPLQVNKHSIMHTNSPRISPYHRLPLTWAVHHHHHHQ